MNECHPEPAGTEASRPSGSRNVDTRSLIELLNNEIDLVVQGQQRPGWTVWAVLASLGTLFWLLINQIEGASGKLEAVPRLFTSFSLLFGSLELLFFSLGPTPFKNLIRAKLQSYFDEDRPSLMFEFTRRLLLLFLILAYSKFIPTQWVILSVTYLVAPFFFTIATLRLSFLRLPRVVYSNFAEWGFSILLVVVSIGLFISSFDLYSETLNEVEFIGLADYRISLLLLAIGFLIHRLISQTKEPPLVLTLVDLRRELVLGNIALEEAVFRADIVLAGMRVASILQLDVQKMLKLFEEFDALAIEMTKRYQTVSELLPGNLAAATPEELGNALKAMEGSSEQLDRIQLILGEIQRLHRKFAAKSEVIESVFSKTSPEIILLLSKLQIALENAKQRTEEVSGKQKPLTERAKAYLSARTSGQDA
jgi:hypothetical protein